MANPGGQGRIQGLSKLSPRHRRVIDNYLISGNKTKAYQKEYPNASLKTCANEGGKIIRQSGVTIATLMDSMGLTKGKLIKKIDQKMESKKIHGTSDDFIEVDDNPSQLKAVEIAGKWLGMDKGTQVNVQVNIPILGGKSSHGSDNVDD